MSLKFKHIRFALWLSIGLLAILPFDFKYKMEISVVLLAIIIIVLVLYLFIPQEKDEAQEQFLLAQTKIRALEKQKHDFLESIPVPFAIINNNLNVILSNPAYEKSFNDYKNSLKQAAHDFKVNINKAIRSTGATRQTVYVHEREYLMLSSHLQLNNKKVTLLILNDVTSYSDAQKIQRRFIADASHELKTPITAIKGMTELLVTHDLKVEDQKEFLNQINKETNRLQTIVTDLLEISKLTSNRIILNYSLFNFSDLIKDVYHSLKTVLFSKNLVFIYDFSYFQVYLDYERMHQVLSNLMMNAINYSDEGNIELKIFKEKNHLIMVLKDQGVGIDQKHLPYIFDRFYRVDDARTRTAGGSGLGLSIVKEIVIAHEGMIEVNSQKGQGTQFRISLPINN